MKICFPCYKSPSKISSLIGPENTGFPWQAVERRGKINEGLIKELSVSCCTPEIAAAPAPGTPARPGPGRPTADRRVGALRA